MKKWIFSIKKESIRSPDSWEKLPVHGEFIQPCPCTVKLQPKNKGNVTVYGVNSYSRTISGNASIQVQLRFSWLSMYPWLINATTTGRHLIRFRLQWTHLTRWTIYSLIYYICYMYTYFYYGYIKLDRLDKKNISHVL